MMWIVPLGAIAICGCMPPLGTRLIDTKSGRSVAPKATKVDNASHASRIVMLSSFYFGVGLTMAVELTLESGVLAAILFRFFFSTVGSGRSCRRLRPFRCGGCRESGRKMLDISLSQRMSKIVFEPAGREVDIGEDFASTIGAGGVLGTKFTCPDYRPRFDDAFLTPRREIRWQSGPAFITPRCFPTAPF